MFIKVQLEICLLVICLPNAYLLILVCEMNAVSAVIVEGHDVVHGVVEEVLDTALRGKVVELAGKLGDLKKHLTGYLFNL